MTENAYANISKVVVIAFSYQTIINELYEIIVKTYAEASLGIANKILPSASALRILNYQMQK
jgi:hypothetical protein